MKIRINKTKNGGYVSTYLNDSITSLVCKEVSDIDAIADEYRRWDAFILEEMPLGENDIFDFWLIERTDAEKQIVELLSVCRCSNILDAIEYVKLLQSERKVV